MAPKRSREASSSSSSTPAPKRIQQTSSSFSSTPQWIYDVFLSFRGEDTGKNFTEQLYNDLAQNGIQTFREDDEIKQGEDISSELLKAIEQSKIAVVVFSKNYASSRWCLDELVKILQCRKVIGQTVLPIFYNVDPTDVRNQSGNFAKSFAIYEERFKDEMGKVEKWRETLTETANISGWDLRNVANGHESKFIQGIVDEVIMRVNQTYLNVATYPIGIESRVQDINMLLNVRSDDVRIVGIYGLGGIGKTTVAKAVYNLMFRKFDGSSFLSNVREESKQHNGLVHLQEQLLIDVLKKKLTINNVDRGINVIKERLCCKRVLVVLDDVDQSCQLNALAGKCNWFGSGSRIMITTRDVHLLKRIEVDAYYEAKEMNHHESLQLFSWHAFGQEHPKKEYEDLSSAVVHYTGGLPLALEVLGSFLFDKRSIVEWRSALEKLQKIPNDRVQERLRISYDALDYTQKVMFLDIACFFIGMDKDYVLRILDTCGLFPDSEINVLVQKSLVKIDGDELRMHDLLRDMGREIVHEESPKEPGERSRLWFLEDSYHVLTKNTGTNKVQGLILNLPRLEGVSLKIKAFENMENLRLLQVNYIQLSEGYGHLFKELFPFMGEKHLFKKLRWLCWHGFNLEYIPINFHLENLAILDMQDSSLRQVWKRIKLLKKLKVLNLSHSHFLTRTPDFLGLPNLERLILEGCTSLIEVHQSIGHLNKLVFLNLKDCKNLYNIPRSICDLKSLENLLLSGCSKLEELPKDLGNMEPLIELLADGTAIKQLPFSIGLLKNLEKLSLSGCKGSPFKSWISFFWSMKSPRKSPDSITPLLASFSGLCSLKCLSLMDCNLLEEAIPNDLWSLASLQDLDLSNNNFSRLPSSISHLSRLQTFSLCDCTKLQSLPELPSSLKLLHAANCASMEGLTNLGSVSSLQQLNLSANNFCSLPSNINRLSHLTCLTLEECTRIQSLPELPSSIITIDADGCTSMERISNLSNLKYLESLQIKNCRNLIEVQGLEGLESQPFIHMERCKNLANTFRKSLFQGMQERGIFNIILPGSVIPEWFSHQGSGCSVSFEASRHRGCRIEKLIVCAIFAANEDSDVVMNCSSSRAIFCDKTKGLDWTYHLGDSGKVITREDHVLVANVPHALYGYPLEGWDEVHLSIEVEKPVRVKKCGIHLVYESKENVSMSNSY